MADRDLVEQGADEILHNSQNEDVALLVVGDPFGATTHTDLVLRAKEHNIPVQIIHNASILNAIGCCGLQLYSFGETVSIPYWTDSWRPDSFFDKIIGNYQRNLHTLCLLGNVFRSRPCLFKQIDRSFLDIKVKEPTLESLTKKKKEYMPPRFMSVAEASQQILEIIKKRSDSSPMTSSSLAVGLARVGSEEQKIIACSLTKMAEVDLGPPLHSLVVTAKDLHPLEIEYLQQFH